MKKYITRILGGMLLLSLITVRTSLAPPNQNQFDACNPSGYDCNILIAISKTGVLSVTSNPNMPYYPFPPLGWTDIGSLIGFKNSSNSTVYNLRLTDVTGNPQIGWLCTPPSTQFNAANVKIINIPDGYNFEAPPYYFYQSCFPGTCTNPLRYSCDVVFSGGVPKGGSSYFSLGRLAPNYPGYFNVSLPPVVPSLSFQDDLGINETANATLTLSPPNTSSVTLTLTTTTGTGEAVFQSNNSATLLVTAGAPVQI